MMVEPGTQLGLNALGDAVAALQRSARQTIPMFAVGILATLIAAGVAVYYIVTLSADLREARRDLQQSESALQQARSNMAVVTQSLRDAQDISHSNVEAKALEAAISKVSRSQKNITDAASSISDAKARISPTGGISAEVRQIAGTCRLQVGSVTHLSGRCEIELARGGTFWVYAIGRQGPSAHVRRDGSVGIGSWRATPGTETVELGVLRRRGACWSNDTASICAWDSRR